MGASTLPGNLRLDMRAAIEMMAPPTERADHGSSPSPRKDQRLKPAIRQADEEQDPAALIRNVEAPTAEIVLQRIEQPTPWAEKPEGDVTIHWRGRC